jgi:hypothetical protein
MTVQADPGMLRGMAGISAADDTDYDWFWKRLVGVWLVARYECVGV